MTAHQHDFCIGDYVLQGNYGKGWEDLTSETTMEEARQRRAEYRESGDPVVEYRIVRY